MGLPIKRQARLVCSMSISTSMADYKKRRGIGQSAVICDRPDRRDIHKLKEKWTEDD